jgi:transcriptional regulator with XRE-family HTH domain
MDASLTRPDDGIAVALFNRTLRVRREERGLGQAQLARRVGVTQQTVSRWESGEFTPPPKRLVHLAQALELDLDHLLTYGGYLPNVADWPCRHVPNMLYDRIGGLSG